MEDIAIGHAEWAATAYTFISGDDRGHVRRAAVLLVLLLGISAGTILPAGSTPAGPEKTEAAASSSGRKAAVRPYSGEWESFDPLDGSYQTLSISDGRGARIRVELRDTGATVCGTDEFDNPLHAAIAAGTGIPGESTLNATLQVRCVGRPHAAMGRVGVVFSYDPARDTLMDSFDPAATWTRFDSIADPLTIYSDGVVVTMETSRPVAASIATRRDRIVAVGGDMQLSVIRERTTDVVDLKGRAVLPGFIDSHAHWIGDREVAGIETPQEAIAAALRDGWTSISELFVNQDRLDELVGLDGAGQLPIRVNGYLPINYHDDIFGEWFTAYAPRQEFSNHLRIAGIKAFVDRASPELMFLSEEHSNMPGYFGHASWTQAQLTSTVSGFHGDGWQIAIHTAGDAAHDMVLNAFEAALDGESNENYRHRIEHVVLLRDEQIHRIRTLGIIASIQLPWFNSDWLGDEFWGGYEDVLGPERLPWIGRWRDLLDADVTMIGGTDAPWTPASSMKALHEAVTRIGETGLAPDSWMLAQRITVEEALRLITIDAAYGTFDEDVKGSIAPGKYADLVVLSESPLHVSIDDLPDIQVLGTIVGGRAQYCSPTLAELCH